MQSGDKVVSYGVSALSDGPGSDLETAATVSPSIASQARQQVLEALNVSEKQLFDHGNQRSL